MARGVTGTTSITTLKKNDVSKELAKQRSWTQAEKRRIHAKWITAQAMGVSKAAFCRTHKIDRQVLTRIINNIDKIREAPDDFRRLASPRLKELDAAMVSFVEKETKKAEDRTTPGRILLEAARIRGKPVSRRWWRTFARRHKYITMRRLHGDGAKCCAVTVARFRHQWRDFTRNNGYPPEMIFNGDESLLYVQRRNRAWIVRSSMVIRTARGTPDGGPHLGLAVCIGADGSVLPLIVAHTATRPRSYPSAQALKLSEKAHGYMYDASSDGWVKTTAWLRWLTSTFLPHLRSLVAAGRQPKAVLLLDNHPAHRTFLLELWRAQRAPLVEPAESANPLFTAPAIDATNFVPILPRSAGARGPKGGALEQQRTVAPATSPEEKEAADVLGRFGADVRFGNLTIAFRFLPPNTTPQLQPADQGFFARLKAKFRSGEKAAGWKEIIERVAEDNKSTSAESVRKMFDCLNPKD